MKKNGKYEHQDLGNTKEGAFTSLSLPPAGTSISHLTSANKDKIACNVWSLLCYYRKSDIEGIDNEKSSCINRYHRRRKKVGFVCRIIHSNVMCVSQEACHVSMNWCMSLWALWKGKCPVTWLAVMNIPRSLGMHWCHFLELAYTVSGSDLVKWPHPMIIWFSFIDLSWETYLTDHTESCIH